MKFVLGTAWVKNSWRLLSNAEGVDESDALKSLGIAIAGGTAEFYTSDTNKQNSPSVQDADDPESKLLDVENPRSWSCVPNAIGVSMNPISLRDYVHRERDLMVTALENYYLLPKHSVATPHLSSYVLKDAVHGGPPVQVVISRATRAIAVFGDLETVVFQYFDPSYTVPEALAWIAESEFDYVLEKAIIGTGRDVCVGWSPEVGRVPSNRVLTGWCLLKRLLQLLDSTEGEDSNQPLGLHSG